MLGIFYAIFWVGEEEVPFRESPSGRLAAVHRFRHSKPGSCRTQAIRFRTFFSEDVWLAFFSFGLHLFQFRLCQELMRLDEDDVVFPENMQPLNQPTISIEAANKAVLHSLATDLADRIVEAE